MRSTNTEIFVRERLVLYEKPLTDTIQKNKFALFATPRKIPPTRFNYKMSSLKANCALFSQMYIACQSRQIFFAHENQACPPSLSDMGNLRQCKKSDLLPCLQNTQPGKVVHDREPIVEAEVLDGAAIIHMLQPKDVKTFDDYAEHIFMPYIRRQLQKTNRVDVVWDRYIVNSIKQSTRDKRGTGQRRRVLSTTPLPTNWQSFLQTDANN